MLCLTHYLHSVNLAHQIFSTEHLLKCCADFYERDGFVKWADVARALGVSRQGVMHRLQKLLSEGALDPETYDKWQSMSARRAVARQNRADQRAQQRRTLQILITPENDAWLRHQKELRRLTNADIINGLITRARESEEA